jgi:trimethylamine:corrinoid methyltransferase-like protein
LNHPSIFSRISNQKWVERNENICQLAAKRADQLLKSYTAPRLDQGLARRLKDALPFFTNS